MFLYAEIDYEISGNTITVTGDKNAYLVLKSDVKTVTIGETSCNIIGQAEASVKNSGNDDVTVNVVCAGYKKGKLVEINVRETTLSPGNSIVSFDGDYSEADTYRIIILDTVGKIAPRTIKKSGKKQLKQNYTGFMTIYWSFDNILVLTENKASSYNLYITLKKENYL